MIEEISDTKLQGKLRKIIAEHKEYIPICKSILYCGSQVIKQQGCMPAVFVLANEEKSRFYGQTSCKNSWGCPVCSARQMSKYAAEIACAIEALKKPPHNQIAFMLTLTIPHTSGMSCEETTEILYNTWKDFIVHGNKVSNAKYYANSENKYKHGQQKKLVTSNKKLNDPFSMFCQEFGCKHRVRVGEFTWGEHGWHPHFHCLFWVDRDKFKFVKDWQGTFERRWLELAKRNTIKQWDKMIGNRNGKVGVGLGKAAEVPEAIRKGVDDAKKNNRIRAEIMYSKLNDVSHAAYISVDKVGNVIEQKSSSYICGWGADKELTGNIEDKATKEGHFTPRQILEMATLDPNDKYAKLYLEYLRATRIKKHARINFSTRSGIKDIIKNYKKTHEYIETLKKKVTTNPNVGLRVVFWFTEEQWKRICFIEGTIDPNIRVKILQIARRRDAENLIIDYLMSKGVDTMKNGKHHLQKFIEEKVFGNYAA